MLKYEFFLQNNKARAYRLFNWLIILLNLAALVSVILYGNDRARIVALVATGLILLPAVYWNYRKKKETENDKLFNYIFGCLFLSWFVLHYYWPAALMLILTIFQHLALKKSLVHVSSGKITYPSFTARQIQWAELNNIMIKDGLLTIDFKNNKLIQQLIDSRISSVNEKEFNDFCRQQLKK